MANDKKLLPGDEGYLGGVTETTAVINGKAYNVKVVKDSKGNVVYTSTTPKIFGIF